MAAHDCMCLMPNVNQADPVSVLNGCTAMCASALLQAALKRSSPTSRSGMRSCNCSQSILLACWISDYTAASCAPVRHRGQWLIFMLQYDKRNCNLACTANTTAMRLAYITQCNLVSSSMVPVNSATDTPAALATWMTQDNAHTSACSQITSKCGSTRSHHSMYMLRLVTRQLQERLDEITIDIIEAWLCAVLADEGAELLVAA